ncbi:MAG: heat-inducible transcription repressor HrcA [Candidatus Latescibacterota bacterium]|nr:MAG: heat-inducible transcription repressor HrcA [Candidatus Latescibacterota bacterium]
MNEPSERDKAVLESLIHSYITLAVPVGSRTLSKRYHLGISSATIRNVVMDLEEMGYVSQPHTSAGRIPTDKGYRFYVDTLMSQQTLSQEEQAEIDQKVEAAMKEHRTEDILEQICKVIGDVSHQLGIVLSPRFDMGVLHKIELVSLTERRILVVLTIRSGLAKTLVLEVTSKVKPEELSETARVLNERLSGLTIEEIQHSMKERIQSASKGDPKLLRIFMDEADEVFQFQHSEDLHVGGTSHMFFQPEFQDRETLAEFMSLFEERDPVAVLLSERIHRPGIYVTIGAENDPDAMHACSLVTAPYRVGNVAGVVGIVGPTRMPYPKIAALVDYMAKLVGDVLQD